MKSPTAGGAWAGICTLTLIWGLNWIAMKMALQHADAFVFNIQRTLLAIAALFAVTEPFFMWPYQAMDPSACACTQRVRAHD